MPTGLLDVNVLVALFDPDHVHHEAAHRWFARGRREGWATCPTTEAGFLRVLSNPAYTSAVEPPAAVAERLRTFCVGADHVFWNEGPSLRDRSVFRLENLRGHRQVTDVLLLAVAVRNEGRLVTFDRAIPWRAVTAAQPEHVLLLGP
jgi:toxin-antitoxin system PIN domain toxin